MKQLTKLLNVAQNGKKIGLQCYSWTDSKLTYFFLYIEVLTLKFHSIQARQLDDHMILFLASLPNCVYSSLLNVFQSFSSGETKGQIICKSKQGVGSIELDCKGTQFKCLRGLVLKKVKNVLDDVANGELSLKEMAVKCHNLKQKRSIEEAFVRQLGLG